MGEIKVKIPDDIEKLFRKMAMKRFGYQKGSMSKAAEKAIDSWTKLEEGGELTKDDLWDDLQGVMKNVKKTSVQLQHEAWDFVIDKYMKKERKKK